MDMCGVWRPRLAHGLASMRGGPSIEVRDGERPRAQCVSTSLSPRV
jgi:hypothetical protein